MHTIHPILLFPIIGFLLYILFKGFKGGNLYSEADRARDLAALARKLQLYFDSKSDFEFTKQYLFLRWLNRGDNNCCYNIFRGSYLGHPVIVFDYTFTGGKYSYYWSAYVLEMKTNFPDVLISHESRESRIAEALGAEQITFESAEFSRAFRVRATDKKFAFEVCHPQMMEFLLANQDLTIEIRSNALAVLFEDWLRRKKLRAICRVWLKFENFYRPIFSQKTNRAAILYFKSPTSQIAPPLRPTGRHPAG